MDPQDKTPLQIRPYKLAFEERRVAAKIIEQLVRRSHHAPAFWLGGAGLFGAQTQWRLALGHRPSTFKPEVQRLEDAAPAGYWRRFPKAGQFGAFLCDGYHEGYLECAFLFKITQLHSFYPLQHWLDRISASYANGFKELAGHLCALCELVFPLQDFTEFLQCFLDNLCIFCKDFKALLPALDKILECIIFSNFQFASAKIALSARMAWRWRKWIIWGIQFLKGECELTSKKKSEAAVRKLTPPTCFKELQSLIELFSDFKSFILDFSKIAPVGRHA
jgi:hypothetical protein